ncbi:MAG TPA: PHP domain-containing protein [Acidobacteriota bacterium]|nr:PHP domain-containing protein [Acidobacteriota bacterium]
MPQFIDLHLHTSCSDGVHDPEQLLVLVRKADLAAFSLADHDTLDGYRAIRDIVTDSDPELIAGIELSVSVNGEDLHMLGYLLDPDNKVLVSALGEFQERRNQRGRLMVQRLRDMGLDITFEAVERAAGSAVIGRPHVADAMFELGLVGRYEEAFYRYIGNGRPAYVPKSRLGPRDAVELIHQAGGVAVVAHPIVADMYQYVERLAGLGLDGIELYHYMHKRHHRKQLRALADRFGLLVTGGSDFHGREERSAGIGSQKVPAELLETLKQRAEQIRSRN